MSEQLIASKAIEIGSTELYGDTMTNLEYVLIRGAHAIGLRPSYAKDMLRKLAECQIEEMLAALRLGDSI